MRSLTFQCKLWLLRREIHFSSRFIQEDLIISFRLIFNTNLLLSLIKNRNYYTITTLTKLQNNHGPYAQDSYRERKQRVYSGRWKIPLGSLTHTRLCQALLLMDTNKFLVERKLAGFSFSPYPLFYSITRPAFALHSQMKRMGRVTWILTLGKNNSQC